MNKSYLLHIVVIFILTMLASCYSKEESDRFMKEELGQDIQFIEDSTKSKILRLDSTEITVSDLESKIRTLMNEAKVTGLAISILNNNHIIYKNAFGYANYDRKTSMMINHSFYGASLSKAVFGYLVAILADEGVIDLDKPLQQYLEFPLYELKQGDRRRGFSDLKDDKRYEKITARMCMSHTTGLQNWRWIPRPNDPENDKKLKIYFEPGTQYYYSGEGMMLLQYVIENITKRNYNDLVNEKVLKPLKMNNTSYLWQERFEDKYCNGHTSAQRVIIKDKREEVGAAGSMETNLIDYSLFVKHILELHRDSSSVTKKLFNPNFRIRSKAQFGPLSLQESDENDAIQLNYGLGWGLLYTPYGMGAFKEGHGEGFQHYTIIFPKTGTGIVMMSNSDNAEGIFKELLEISIGDTFTPWRWENYIPYQSEN